MELVLATGNPHKAREFRDLTGAGFGFKNIDSIAGIVMPEETGTTLEENAALKALHVSKFTEDFVIADDSGLEVDSLDGAPGVYSARYAGEHANDDANVQKVLRELSGATERSARFRCVIVLTKAGKVLGIVEGIVEGTITNQPRGRGGFGYDPIFQPNGFAETFAEMAPELKNKISHRGKAVAALRDKLREIAD